MIYFRALGLVGILAGRSREMGDRESLAWAERAPRAEVTPRQPGDDFYCLRYEVWYGSFDCAVRTYFRTCRGCLDCEQGRFNLHRHRDEMGRVRLHRIDIAD
jgi:hypothetical protein